MTTNPRRKTLQDNNGLDKRRQQEDTLDEALKNTFPASDQVSAVQPGHEVNPRGLGTVNRRTMNHKGCGGTRQALAPVPPNLINDLNE